MNRSIVIALSLAAAFAGDALADTKVKESRPASATGTVDVSNVSGAVRIVGWDRAEVAVEGTLGDEVERLEFDGTDGRTVVRVVLPRRNGRFRDADADLTISVPAGSRVIASTVSASLTATGVNGRTELKSVSGDVEVAGGYTDGEFQTVSGDLRVKGSGDGARVRVMTVSGDLEVERVTGELRANSVSGSVVVMGTGVSRATVGSTSGDIRYTGPLAQGGRYEFSTVSGGASVRVLGDTKARYEMESAVSNELRAGFGPKPARTSEYGPGMRWSFADGDDAELSMQTVSGELAIERSR